MPCVVLCKQYVCAKLLTLDSTLTHRSDAVMLNDHTMYEHILDDDIFFGVVGMLECLYFQPSGQDVLLTIYFPQ